MEDPDNLSFRLTGLKMITIFFQNTLLCKYIILSLINENCSTYRMSIFSTSIMINSLFNNLSRKKTVQCRLQSGYQFTVMRALINCHCIIIYHPI